MIKEIICPTDFTAASNSAIEYAAKLTQVLGVRLKILNIQNLLAPFGAISGMTQRGLRDKTNALSDTMNDMCIEINKMFNISCDHDIDLISGSLEKTIAGNAGKDSLIVMGTNGIDDIYQYFFGTNTYNVICKSVCPVWIVPETMDYSPVTKVVFALDYSKNTPAISKIEELITLLKPEITFLNVNTENKFVTPVSLSLKNEIYSLYGSKNLKINFHEEYSESVPEGIDRYVNQTGPVLLVVVYESHGILRSLFHRSITKQIGSTAGYPVLVLQS